MCPLTRIAPYIIMLGHVHALLITDISLPAARKHGSAGIHPSVLFDRKNTFEVIEFVSVLNVETGKQEPQDLEFLPVTWEDYERIYPYTSAYGEGSCQHSPVSMASLAEKYGDAVCMRDGFMYTLRSHLCDEEYRVYLAPLGCGDVAEAFRRIFADAEKYGKKVKFVTLTQKYAIRLQEAFPERFEIVEDRNLAEYMYRSEKMGFFPGGMLKKRRNEVNAFWAKYGERAAVTRITPEDFDDILAFEHRWLSDNFESHDGDALAREERMIRSQLMNFDRMRLSGIVLRIDGEVHGFGYGTKLSDSCYDAIVEKGDRAVPHIYKVLRQEAVRQCALDCDLVNAEEDLGIEGLRLLKYSYQPEFLLRKYIATEREKA